MFRSQILTLGTIFKTSGFKKVRLIIVNVRRSKHQVNMNSYTGQCQIHCLLPKGFSHFCKTRFDLGFIHLKCQWIRTLNRPVKWPLTPYALTSDRLFYTWSIRSIFTSASCAQNRFIARAVERAWDETKPLTEAHVLTVQTDKQRFGCSSGFLRWVSGICCFNRSG